MSEEVKAPRTGGKRTLNVFLGLRERVEVSFKNMLTDMANKFKKQQGLFQGEIKTYTPIEGFADDPSKRSYKSVASTVKEQLDYMTENTLEYLNIVMSIERTNCLSGSQVDLIVEGKLWGKYTQLELLRLKGILDNSLFKTIYSEIPTRELTTFWEVTDNQDFSNRDIYQTRKEEGFSKTTKKTQFIINDPHASQGNRAPQVGSMDEQLNIGIYSTQKFSGEVNISEKAQMLKKIDTLYKAVLAALEEANDVQIVESDLGTHLFNYIHSR